MVFAVALISYPVLIWAYFQFPLLNQFSWTWLIVAFFVYCFLMLRVLARAVESPQKFDFYNGRSGGSGGTVDGGGFSGGSGGDCGGGGGDC